MPEPTLQGTLETAEILGHDQERQAANLISKAVHPAARDDLWEAAGALGVHQRAHWLLASVAWEGPPCTRKSPPALAAFRPWGIQ